MNRKKSKGLRSPNEVAEYYGLDLKSVGPDTPLMLKIAADLVFLDGTMTVAALRTERDRGRLVIERIANKEYTTLANMESMRQQCRMAGKARLADQMDSKAALEWALALASTPAKPPKALRGIEVAEGFEVFRTYKDRKYFARVIAGQKWQDADTGQTYPSLSKLTAAVIGRDDGIWTSWKYIETDGTEHKLRDLRKQGS